MAIQASLQEKKLTIMVGGTASLKAVLENLRYPEDKGQSALRERLELK